MCSVYTKQLCAGVIFVVSMCAMETVMLESIVLEARQSNTGLEPPVIGEIPPFSSSTVQQAVVGVPLHLDLPHSPLSLISLFCFVLSGVCLIAICLACCRKVRKDRRIEERRTMDMLGKRRAAAAVSLAVEGIQQPDSPDQVGLLLYCLYGKEYFSWVGKSTGTFPVVRERL